eukprot:CAMPEP_0116885666 /NCGR_PEP_ID=MMETSP0463-20121206/19178_1 /TAXON_ID=181622 /ORGANISM="Strombidinopsis sp, Strain SopsisLIS2011" /LENGTH=37 /DNA_ID= /DNA_START= /DNA_END= /DNA_ORIENTATION=
MSKLLVLMMMTMSFQLWMDSDLIGLSHLVKKCSRESS